MMEKRYFRLHRRLNSYYALTEMKRGWFYGWKEASFRDSYFESMTGVQAFLKIVNGELV